MWRPLAALGRAVADRVSEPAGTLVGTLAAPIAWLGARGRGDRLFHARGVVHDAEVTAIATSGSEAVLAERLAGDAVVRFSNTWWRGRDWPDLLGVAVRFRLVGGPRQDLVLATVRHPWTFPWAVATTRWNDFLENDYFAVMPYDAEGVGLVELRMRGETGGARAALDRIARLDEAARAGSASLRLELRRLPDGEWRPIALVRIRARRDDARAIRFDPFRVGAGLRPRGFVHALRRAVYAASRRAAPVPTADSSA